MNLEDIERRYRLSIKMGFVGLLFCFTGGFISYVFSYSLGMSLFWFGFILGLVGYFINFSNSIAVVKADRNELFKPPKQPWEKDD